MSESSPAELRARILELVGEFTTCNAPGAPFDPAKDPVRYAGRVFGSEELEALVDASLDFCLTAGRFTEEFEAGFADYLGLSDALLVNSGSSANLVAVTALTSPQLGDRRLQARRRGRHCGRRLSRPRVAPIVQNGLVPVFVDVRLATTTPIPSSCARPSARGPGPSCSRTRWASRSTWTR